MKDQVDSALKLGLRATFINSSLSTDERQQRYKKLGQRQYELLYVTPERFRKSEFLQALQKNQLKLLAVDEAHCISQWGHDFRPDYSRLSEIRKLLGEPLTLALTATATEQVRADIISQLGLTTQQVEVFWQGVVRPNLSLQVMNVHALEEKIRAFVFHHHNLSRGDMARESGATIVYFSLIQNLQKFSYELERLQIAHSVYHGQLPERERKRVQEQFKDSERGVILATPAFGLGVDKENVRLLMHAEIPGSIEAYYQEVGRAGRDGKPADCVLLFDEDDVSIQTDFVNWANPDPGFIQAVYNLIERNLLRAQQEGLDYLRKQMNFYNSRDFRLETALNLLERWGSLEGKTSREWRPIEAPTGEYVDAQLYAQRMRMQKQKLLQMLHLAQMQEGCRMRMIAQYFGDKFFELSTQTKCGVCDLCV